jgi:hypothetical protein
MWGTDIWFLNDQREFKVALDVAAGILEHRREEADTRFRRGLFEALRESLINVLNRHVYVASFSEEGDLLSQWRGYSPRASGYSIGFLTRRLEDAGRLDPSFFLVPCVYDHEKQVELMTSLVEDIVASADRDHEQQPDNRVGTYSKAFRGFGDLMGIMGPTFKHASFEEEREWRIVSMPGAVDASVLEFRTGRYHLIPYCVFALEKPEVRLSISEVIVGPTPDSALALEAARMALARDSVHHENVISSTIPYRHW